MKTNRKNFYDALEQLAKRSGKTDEYVIMQFLLSKSIKGETSIVENKNTGAKLFEGEYQISERNLAIAVGVTYKSVRTTIKNLIKQELLSKKIEKGICIFKINFNVKAGALKSVYSNKLQREWAQYKKKEAHKQLKSGRSKNCDKLNEINELDNVENKSRRSNEQKAGAPIDINYSGYKPGEKNPVTVTGISTGENFENEVELKNSEQETGNEILTFEERTRERKKKLKLTSLELLKKISFESESEEKSEWNKIERKIDCDSIVTEKQLIEYLSKF